MENGSPVLVHNDVYPVKYSPSTMPHPTDISVDPLFVNGAGGDFHLNLASPCLNSGDYESARRLFTDIDGDFRILGGAVDIGADERRPERETSKANDTMVTLRYMPVTAAFNGFLYVEADDRKWGVRVDKASHGAHVGNRVDVAGTLYTNLDGERYVAATTVTEVADGPVDPLQLTNIALGGTDWALGISGAGQMGVAGAFGLNNIGLLVRTSGRVMKVEPSGAYFYIDDGMGLTDTTRTGTAVNVGIRVAADGRNYEEGNYVVVTGVSSCFRDDEGCIQRLLRPRSIADIEIAR